MKEVILTATLPKVAGAVRISGNGHGARLQFDVSDDQLRAVSQLIELRARELEITIRPKVRP
jgi:hypothetical protein